MVCRDFILPESANYVSFYPSSFLRNLSYLIDTVTPEKMLTDTNELLSEFSADYQRMAE